MTLQGWGRFPRLSCHVSAPRGEDELRDRITEGGAIARGNGRAYGDSALSRQNTIHMSFFNRMLAFDDATGQLVVEAGVMLADVIAAFLPRGWFPFVTPGTKFVTIGGMIAADVHGKNHHKDGAFGNFIDWIDIIGPDGAAQRCSPRENADLFGWTVGGMGLTGVIVRAAIRLRRVESGWINQTLIPASDLATAMDIFDQASDATYSVAWIDCLSTGASAGRSLVMLGEHATQAGLPANQRAAPFTIPKKRTLSVPFNAPSFALNSMTVRAFNALYYWRGLKSAGEFLVEWDRFFYPLDAILGWNRIYGRKGFAQFQCVLPVAHAQPGLGAILEATSKAGQGSFLATLKRFGPQARKFSFPMDGYTLALDFPVTKKTLALMTELDRITIDHGGRFYLAKDSRMTAHTLRQSDARTPDFVAMRRESGLQPKFQSAQSERLEL